jgi:hypothetical protein
VTHLPGDVFWEPVKVMAGSIRAAVLKCAKPLHQRFRQQKIKLFLDIVQARGLGGRLLDVGGGPGIGGEFVRLYEQFDEVVSVNLTVPQTNTNGMIAETIVADGRNLPFGDGSFEWVFSNAVIEHVGGWSAQQRFANEVRRVASHGYFVTTPNRFFPVEPHAMLPFYQFLPQAAQRKVASYSPGYLRKYEEIHLLSSRQMKALFPEARVRAVGFPVLGNSLIAYSGCPKPFTSL